MPDAARTKPASSADGASKKAESLWGNDKATAAAYSRLCQSIADAGHIDRLAASVSAGTLNFVERGDVAATSDKASGA
ncbi:hypothetical protein A0W34_13570 [Rhodococcus sp. BH4]|nr:hypothetical protein A0W34_13570 [Rhodococcus sp. BH4]